MDGFLKGPFFDDLLDKLVLFLGVPVVDLHFDDYPFETLPGFFVFVDADQPVCFSVITFGILWVVVDGFVGIVYG